MTASLINGHRVWSMSRDKEGHREYRINHQVQAATTDGPYVVMRTAGLPAIGSVWNFDNDLDPWAFCRPTMKITPRVRDEPNTIWDVEQTFSTFSRQPDRCQDETIEDPLLEPNGISGSFVKYVKEVSQDKDGDAIRSTGFELLRGSQMEFDHNRPTVVISQNVASLGLATFTEMIDTVNSTTLWGLGARKIKLSNVSWERKLYGLCNFYYTRQFEFDIDFTNFDRDVLDEGTKVINGFWEESGWTLKNIDGGPPSVSNPEHFLRYTDRKGNLATTPLQSNGKPAISAETANTITVQYYGESNFLTLGIPTVL